MVQGPEGLLLELPALPPLPHLFDLSLENLFLGNFHFWWKKWKWWKYGNRGVSLEPTPNRLRDAREGPRLRDCSPGCPWPEFCQREPDGLEDGQSLLQFNKVS
jgi:hypothetical protein